MNHPSKLCRTQVLLLLTVLLLITPNVFGQSARGTITGVVNDATGAVVPKAEVLISNKETGEETRAVTTDTGLYRAPYLPPGKYKLSVAMAGFKTAVRDNVNLFVAQTLTADFTLELGEVTQEVTVSSESPLLESSTSEIGVNSTELEVHTWPVIVDDGTRNLQNFIFSSLPGTSGNGFEGTINGGQSMSHEVLIDGITIGRFSLNGGSNTEITATMDAVSEFKLQTGALSAQYGNTQTGLANFGLKSGTNTFHGSAFWLHQDRSLNANSWGNNRFGQGKSPFHDNNFGATVGGPFIKDKTHFFFSYEGDRYADYRVSGLESLPVAPFKQGDFSSLFDPNFTKDPRSGTVVGTDALGRPIIFGQIYDPSTSRQLSDGTWIRDPFPGNIIPQDKFSQVTRNVLKHDIPNPQLLLLRNNNPRVGTCCPFLTIDNFSVKIDHVLSSRHKMAGSFVSNDRNRRRYGGNTYQIPGLPIPGPAAAGDKTQVDPGWIWRLSEDWTISANKLNHFAFGYNRIYNANQSNSFLSGTNWAEELGLQNVAGHAFPVISFGGLDRVLSGSYKNLGHGGTGAYPEGSTIVQNDFTWLRGSHSFRFGGEHRRYYNNNKTVENSGSYSFHNENSGLPGFTDSTGFAYASFLLGVARSTGLFIPFVTQGIRARTTAFYFQDDWKVNSKLTLNMGLRWDIPTPLSEVRSRMAGLNPTKPNPGADGFPGALEMLGTCNGCSGRENFTDVYYREFGPRFGFAYAASPKLVIRGGYGINHAPPLLDGFNFPYTVGFDGSTNITARSGRFREDPSYYWDTPYPPFTGTVPNPDPALLNGDFIAYYLPETNKFPYVQNWNLGVQYELPWQSKLEVNYIGNKGTRLNESNTALINQLDPKYLSLGDALVDDIADHPEIPKPYPSFEGTVGQSLRPFPQYYNINSHRLNNGYSNYHSLQVTTTKRSNRGLSFIAAYTFSKALGVSDSALPNYYYGYGSQNYYDRRADYSVSSFHAPHDLKLTWIYEFPFGPQARWLKSGVLSKIIGGWNMSAIQRYRSGAPLAITASDHDSLVLFNGAFRGDVLLPRDQQVIGSKPDQIDPENGTQYLNPAAFGSPPISDNGVPIRLGNAPRFLPNLRGFARYSEDFSLIKRTALGFREGTNFEIRIDVINLFNRAVTDDPNTDAGDLSNFGKIFGKGGGPRTIQIGARITF